MSKVFNTGGTEKKQRSEEGDAYKLNRFQPTLCCQSHVFFTNNCFTNFAQALLKMDDAITEINKGGELQMLHV